MEEEEEEEEEEKGLTRHDVNKSVLSLISLLSGTSKSVGLRAVNGKTLHA